MIVNVQPSAATPQNRSLLNLVADAEQAVPGAAASGVEAGLLLAEEEVVGVNEMGGVQGRVAGAEVGKRRQVLREGVQGEAGRDFRAPRSHGIHKAAQVAVRSARQNQLLVGVHEEAPVILAVSAYQLVDPADAGHGGHEVVGAGEDGHILLLGEEFRGAVIGEVVHDEEPVHAQGPVVVQEPGRKLHLVAEVGEQQDSVLPLEGTDKGSGAETPPRGCSAQRAPDAKEAFGRLGVQQAQIQSLALQPVNVAAALDLLPEGMGAVMLALLRRQVELQVGGAGCIGKPLNAGKVACRHSCRRQQPPALGVLGEALAKGAGAGLGLLQFGFIGKVLGQAADVRGLQGGRVRKGIGSLAGEGDMLAAGQAQFQIGQDAVGGVAVWGLTQQCLRLGLAARPSHERRGREAGAFVRSLAADELQIGRVCVRRVRQALVILAPGNAQGLAILLLGGLGHPQCQRGLLGAGGEPLAQRFGIAERAHFCQGFGQGLQGLCRFRRQIGSRGGV